MNDSTTLNLPLLRRIRDGLRTGPELFTDGEAKVSFDMGHYIAVEEVQDDVDADGEPTTIPDFCQTSCCLAGAAVLLSGRMSVREALGSYNSNSCDVQGIVPNERSIAHEAREELGLTETQADDLFMWTSATREQMADHLTAMIDAGEWLPVPTPDYI